MDNSLAHPLNMLVCNGWTERNCNFPLELRDNNYSTIQVGKSSSYIGKITLHQNHSHVTSSHFCPLLECGRLSYWSTTEYASSIKKYFLSAHCHKLEVDSIHTCCKDEWWSVRGTLLAAFTKESRKTGMSPLMFFPMILPILLPVLLPILLSVLQWNLQWILQWFFNDTLNDYLWYSLL